MTWLGFKFDTVQMTITLPPEKLIEIMELIHNWTHRVMATIQELWSLMGKLLHVAQCCPPVHLFTNRMLDTLLSTEFQKDVTWFQSFFPRIDCVFLIHEDTRVPIPLFVDACTSICRAVTTTEAYHVEFPNPIAQKNLSICHLEALNAIVTIKVCVPTFTKQLVHLFSDNSMAVANFQAARGKDSFI